MGKRSIPRVVVVVAVGCLIFPLAVARWEKNRRPPAPPFRFPSPELAALDRDMQARFAIVPEKDFGIVRTYGPQHYLYNPSTPAERATVAALRKSKTEVAFYLMSRSLWLQAWDGAGYKPIQGPVVIDEKIQAPLPRKVNFFTDNRTLGKPVLDQEDGFGPEQGLTKQGIPTHNPDGTPVPSPTPPSNAPDTNKLQELGNTVFEAAEGTDATQSVGDQTTWKEWKIVAVPIRASQEACLPCHKYDMPRKRPLPGKIKVGVGDALGVAFYMYRGPAAKKGR